MMNFQILCVYDVMSSDEINLSSATNTTQISIISMSDIDQYKFVISIFHLWYDLILSYFG